MSCAVTNKTDKSHTDLTLTRATYLKEVAPMKTCKSSWPGSN